MMKTTCLLALMMLVSAGSVSAADGDKDKDTGKSASTDQKEKSDKDQDKVICRSDRATGSLTRVNRICHTRAQWNEIAEEARKNVNDISRRQNIGADSGSANGARNASGF
jgi:hypothetical protein